MSTFFNSGSHRELEEMDSYTPEEWAHHNRLQKIADDFMGIVIIICIVLTILFFRWLGI
jgi:uncharacterized membrane protein YkgB